MKPDATQFQTKAHPYHLDYRACSQICQTCGMPSSRVENRLLEYRDAGIQVALDDFGSGYSSMSYLQKLDIDYRKIDQSFVNDTTTNPHSRAIAGSIILMTHKLGLKVIAEGIETEEQRACLVSARCDYGHGYLFVPLYPRKLFKSGHARCASRQKLPPLNECAA